MTEYEDYVYAMDSYESTPIYDALKEKAIEGYSLGETKGKHFLVGWNVEISNEFISLTYRIVVKSECFYCGQKVRSSENIADEFIHGNYLEAPNFMHELLSRLVMESIRHHTSTSYVKANEGEAMTFVDNAIAENFDNLGGAVKEASNPMAEAESLYNEYKEASFDSAEKLAAAAYSLPGIHTQLGCPAGPVGVPSPGEKQCGISGSLYTVIAHLNDHHQWTREAIADWLEEIHDPTGENGPNINFRLEETT